MEKKIVQIFYLGIAQDEKYIGGYKSKKAGLPIRELKHGPEYPGGCLKISYALLPQYQSRSLFKGKTKRWHERTKMALLQRTLEKVAQTLPGAVCIISGEMIMNKKPGRFGSVSAEEMPAMPLAEPLPELTAAHLHSYAPFEKVGVVFSKEGGSFEAREMILLLAPYLRRIRQVVLVGEEGPAAEMFSEYLYYEYGLLPERYPAMPEEYTEKKSGMIWVEAAERKEEIEKLPTTGKAFGRINRQETLKFLDTVIKNGYNTES